MVAVCHRIQIHTSDCEREPDLSKKLTKRMKNKGRLNGKKQKKVMSLSSSAKYVPQPRVSLMSRIRFQDKFAVGCLKLSLELISLH